MNASEYALRQELKELNRKFKILSEIVALQHKQIKSSSLYSEDYEEAVDSKIWELEFPL